MLPAREIIKSWKEPVDYLIDPSKEGHEIVVGPDEYDNLQDSGGVLVTITTLSQTDFTVWIIVNRKRDCTIGVVDNIPMDRNTLLLQIGGFANGSESPCLCMYASIPESQSTKSTAGVPHPWFVQEGHHEGNERKRKACGTEQAGCRSEAEEGCGNRPTSVPFE